MFTLLRRMVASSRARARSLVSAPAAALAVALASAVLVQPAVAAPKQCLLISSYHPGYAWSDGVERGLRAGLGDHCQLDVFYMDSKRHKAEADIRSAAQTARDLIDSTRPDVVITADDNAARYIVAPWYRDHDIPFVFCGINWTVDEYDFPYSNVTGMVEVAPIGAMLRVSIRALSDVGRAFYLGADTPTERKNLARFQRAAAAHSIQLDAALTPTVADWLNAFQDAQQYDLIILGSNAGIPDWQQASIAPRVRELARRLSVTNHGWMMPYAMLGMTKVPEEQGEWAAQAAAAILGGEPPSSIPIVANRRWDLWINPALLDAAAVVLPAQLLDKAKRVAEFEGGTR